MDNTETLATMGTQDTGRRQNNYNKNTQKKRDTTPRRKLKQVLNKRQRIPKGQSKMDNPEKLTTLGTQDEEKQSKKSQHNMLHTTIRKQTQIT